MHIHYVKIASIYDVAYNSFSKQLHSFISLGSVEANVFKMQIQYKLYPRFKGHNKNITLKWCSFKPKNASQNFYQQSPHIYKICARVPFFDIKVKTNLRGAVASYHEKN